MLCCFDSLHQLLPILSLVLNFTKCIVLCLGNKSPLRRGGFQYSTAAAVEEPIKPAVDVNYSQLLIDGQFVDAVSGELSVQYLSRKQKILSNYYVSAVYLMYLCYSCFKVDLDTGKTFATLDPRSGDVIAQVAEGDAEDINRAVVAARRAFDQGPWPKMTAYVILALFFFFF